MIECKRCGSKNPDGARYCSMCGERLIQDTHVEPEIAPAEKESKPLNETVKK